MGFHASRQVTTPGQNRAAIRCAHTPGCLAHTAFKSSGNTAFDAYKADTLRRLEEEQDAFEAFLNRLRDAKDKAEFDQFMDERSKKKTTSDYDADAQPA
mgnify:CR=1 FL=1